MYGRALVFGDSVHRGPVKSSNGKDARRIESEERDLDGKVFYVGDVVSPQISVAVVEQLMANVSVYCAFNVSQAVVIHFMAEEGGEGDDGRDHVIIDRSSGP